MKGNDDMSDMSTSINLKNKHHIAIFRKKTEFHVKMAHINVIMATGIILPCHHDNNFCHHVNAMMTS
jgi:hypothetical protein